MKLFSLIIMLVLSIAAAQTTPVSLPLTLEGTESQVSQTFIANDPWQIEVSSGEVSSLYLYDATTGKNLRKLESGDTVQETGAFFIYVVVTDGVAWQLTLGGDAATADATSDATTPEPTTTPSTPETTSPAPLPPVDKRTEKNWNRHFGFEVSRFTRTAGATPGECSTYASALEAQAAFIEAGGPETDPDNLDTDGDGYACSYNPFDQSYIAAITCETGKEWINPRYRRDGTYNPGGCRPIKTE